MDGGRQPGFEIARWMRAHHQPRPLRAWLVAIGLPLLATLATAPFFRHDSVPPFAFYTLAVALATWYAGFRYGLGTLGISVALLVYIQVSERIPSQSDDPDRLPRLVLWALVAAAIALLLSLLRTAYQELWTTSERFRLVQESARVWSWELKPESGEIVWSSPQAEHLHHGRLSTLLERVHPQDRAGVEQAIAQALRQRTGYALEFRVLAPNGEVHWVLSRAVVFQSDGRPARVVGVNADITVRKRAEQAEVEAATGRMAADLAHQLNNPLEMLISSLYLLEGSCRQDQARVYLDAAREGAARVSQLVRELLRLYPRRQAQ